MRAILNDAEGHHRHSIRLKAFDYGQAGAYFVTIVTHERETLFGSVFDGAMANNSAGQIAAEEWSRAGDVRPNVVVDAFAVMPNHIHGIIVLTEPAGANRRLAPAPGMLTPPPAGSLGAIIAQFKSITTKRINRLRGTPALPIWQRNYFEHIIRNDKSLDRIREYIADNPARWEHDPENPTATMLEPEPW